MEAYGFESPCTSNCIQQVDILNVFWDNIVLKMNVFIRIFDNETAAV